MQELLEPTKKHLLKLNNDLQKKKDKNCMRVLEWTIVFGKGLVSQFNKKPNFSYILWAIKKN